MKCDMRYQFYTADVFSDRAFGGNPLAVFPHATGLSAVQMQKVAAEFNFSETAFVFPPETPKAAERGQYTVSTASRLAGQKLPD